MIKSRKITILTFCLFLTLTLCAQDKTFRQIIQHCQSVIAENPDLALQMMCILVGQNQPESYPTIALQQVPDKCQKESHGFYTKENYQAVKQQVLNLKPDIQPHVGQIFPLKSSGYWCDEQGKPSQGQFQQVIVYTSLCMYGQNRQHHIYCLGKVEPYKPDPRSIAAPPQEQESNSPGILVTLQTIILFPFFLIFCWILPFFGTIFSKNQHEKWITFWILNMVLSFLLVPILEWLFYNPMILLIRICISIVLVMLIKHSLVEKLLGYVDIIHDMVKAQYSKLKQKAIGMSASVFGQ